MLTLKLVTKLNDYKDYSLEFFQDKILIENYNYEKIFGIKASGTNEHKKNRIVVIKAKNGKNKIYRQFVGGTSFGIKKDEAYITFQSLNELDNSNKITEIIIEAGNKYLYELLFLWYHPSITARVVFKVGVILGLLSIILGCISLLK